MVLGPLNQGIREVQEEEFERDALMRAVRQVEVPDPVSVWWLALPPVYVVLRRRRNHVYKHRVRDAMSPEDLQAFAHLRDVAGAWFLVAAGASLIAVKETWELVEVHQWAEWIFWVLLGILLVVAVAVVVVRIRRSDHA